MELFMRLMASWKLILCLALVGALAAGVYTSLFVTPMYRATAIIYVLDRDSALSLSDLNLGTALTNDYIKVFNMWEVHEQVIKNLNLPYSYTKTRGMLSVTNSTNTRMLDITVTSPNPHEAALVANEFANVGREYIHETMATDMPRTMSQALVPSNPVSPNKTRNIIMGFLLGVMAAAGYVTLRMLLDDKYKTANDIRKYTGLVVLATIPKNKGTADKSGKEYTVTPKASRDTSAKHLKDENASAEEGRRQA